MYGSQNTALSYNDFKAFCGIRVGYEEGSTLLVLFNLLRTLASSLHLRGTL